MAWQTDVTIPPAVERDCKPKPCADCGAPIRLLAQESRDHPISVVDATPNTGGWFHLFDDGTAVFARRDPARRRLTAVAGFIASFQTHRCDQR